MFFLFSHIMTRVQEFACHMHVAIVFMICLAKMLFVHLKSCTDLQKKQSQDGSMKDYKKIHENIVIFIKLKF